MEIKLTQGKIALVDDEDYEWLSQWKWCAHCSNKTRGKRRLWYAVHNHYENGRQRTWLMHRLIMEARPGSKVDHKNHDGLDNRRFNLRITDSLGNGRHCLPHADGTSRFRGVNWYKSHRKWRANISINGKQTYLGLFVTEEEAALAYNRAALREFGEFAYLNKVDDSDPNA